MQNRDSGRDPLLFIHLPKTAGGSVKALLERSFPPDELYLFYDDDYERGAVEAKGVKLVYGHFNYGFHERLGSAPRYCCFLRNPVERTISHYFHLVHAEPGHFGDMARGFKTLGEFVEKSNYYANMNMMCRLLTDTGLVKGISDDELFERASENMEKEFPIFGIFEMLSLSLEVLRRAIGVSIEGIPTVNKGSYRLPELTRYDLDCIIEANQADIRLYRWATERFFSVIVPEAFSNPPLVVPSQPEEVPLGRCA